MTVFKDEAPLVIFVGIVLVLVSAVAVAYVLPSQKRQESVRRRASWIAALVSAIVALFATMHFAIPDLEDLHKPGVNFREALLGAAIEWSICLCAWGIAARCVFSASREGSGR
jgi:cytosine/uracil/thiamine/allantoin permease